MQIERPFPHEDADHFRSCIAFTAKERDFIPNLVEKDYFCSLILSVFAGIGDDLVFKGGTCLGKVFLDFFRLSEDLDFSVSVSRAAKRSHRRKVIAPYKEAVDALTQQLPGVAVKELLTGRNESTQYVAAVEYASLTSLGKGSIKIEIGLREELLCAPSHCPVQTLLRNSITGDIVLAPFPFVCIDQQEAWAEKTRAALCRLEPAIRDFFDLDYAVREKRVNLQSPEFISLVRRKLAVPGNGPVQLTPERRTALDRQVKTELQPVLRAPDLRYFDLGRIWSALTDIRGQI